MNYEPLLNTPYLNARKATGDLWLALYDLAAVFHSLGNSDKAGEMVNARDSLRVIEKVLQDLDKQQTEALDKELQDAGVY